MHTSKSTLRPSNIKKRSWRVLVLLKCDYSRDSKAKEEAL